MKDIGIFLDENGFDLDIENGDLKKDNGLETAVTISLFSDKRVTDDQLPDLESNKRGWWADSLLDNDNDQIGSRLWTLDREKSTNEILNRSKELCKESLDWMIKDGLADEIRIQSEYNVSKELIINIEIIKPDNNVERYAVYWDQQKLRRL